MNAFYDQIKEKINKEINPEDIALIDNSNLHSKHKSFDPKKYHIKIIITSDKLRSSSPDSVGASSFASVLASFVSVFLAAFFFRVFFAFGFPASESSELAASAASSSHLHGQMRTWSRSSGP